MAKLGKRKISMTMTVIMVVVAAVFDLINIGLDFISFGLISWFVDAIEALLFSIWFSHLGVSLWSTKNVGSTLLTIVLDAIPFGDLTFPWTTKVIYTCMTAREPV